MLSSGTGTLLFVSIKTFIAVHGFELLNTFVPATILFNFSLYISSLWAS
jgi:hypothetical protein